jgi:hypothetical protein
MGEGRGSRCSILEPGRRCGTGRSTQLLRVGRRSWHHLLASDLARRLAFVRLRPVALLTLRACQCRVWDVGAVGEERLGHRLSELATDNLRALHDRRVQGSRANIDHLAVTPTGVGVIDAEKYRGRPHLKVEGEALAPRELRSSWSGSATAPPWSRASSRRSRSFVTSSTTPFMCTACSASSKPD